MGAGNPYFEAEEACQILLDACRSTRFARPYRLGGLVILPDHWHALITPLGNEVIESIVGSINNEYFMFQDSKAQRKREFAADMGLQAHALRCAAEGAVAAYQQVIGETWKPYDRQPEVNGAKIDRKAAAHQMSAFG